MAIRFTNRIIIRIIICISALFVLGGIVEVLIHHYDPTRVVYKRLKADDEYVYEKIDPKLGQRFRLAVHGFPCDPVIFNLAIAVSKAPALRLALFTRHLNIPGFFDKGLQFVRHGASARLG